MRRAGDATAAAALYARALDGYAATCDGGAHPPMLQAMHSLADVHAEAGDPARAIPLYEELLDHREDEFGPQSPEALLVARQLARVYSASGEYRSAVPLYRRELAMHEAAHGAGHPAALDAAYTLAIVLREAGEAKEAEAIFARTGRNRAPRDSARDLLALLDADSVRG